MKKLDPEQRELVREDVRAANDRVETVQKMASRWANGEWSPEEWGMENDPIQLGERRHAQSRSSKESGEAGVAVEGAEPRAVERSAPEKAPPPSESREAKQAASGPSDPWADYVRQFIAKYSMNGEQQQKAWMFHGDARERADLVERRFQRITGEARAADGARDATRVAEQDAVRQRDLQRLFEWLKRRLDRLPTRAQRKQAHAP